MTIYLVGGAVRDAIMDRPGGGDRDWVVLGASQEDFLARFPGARQVGRKGFTWIWRGEEYTLSDAPDILGDLQGRDLSINAVARGEDGRVIALPGALEDIRNRVLRPVAEKNFRDDPLRVLRAARFAACLPGFSAAPGLAAAMRGARDLLGQPAAERVGMELRKACACPAPERFLDLLAEAGCLLPWLEEFAASDRLARVRAALAALPRVAQPGPLAVWMVLCHVLAPAEAVDLAERLRLPSPWRKAAVAAAAGLRLLARYAELSRAERAELLPGLAKQKLFSPALAAARALNPALDAEAAATDLKTLLAVRLPDEARDMGEESGALLARLRIEALRR